MKKLFALLLALALLVPMALTPVAQAEDFTTRPFYTLNWSKVDETKHPYVNELFTINVKNIGADARFEYGSISVLYGQYTDDELTELAQAMKTEMDKRLEGSRHMTIFGVAQYMRITAENVLFMDESVKQLKEMYTALLTRYKEIGGKLDGMVLDVEYEGLACWWIQVDTDKQDNNAVKNPLVYREMVEDPRYATEVRPLLVERGFQFYPNITEYTPEIYSIHRNAQMPTSRAVWDAVMRIRLNNYANEWCYEPLKAIYPEATLSDYQSYDSYGWSKGVALTDDGQTVSGGGNTIRVGTNSSTSYYSVSPNNDFLQNYEKYVSYNEAILEHTGFSGFLHYLNLTRRMYTATDTKLISPWLVDYDYGSKAIASCAGTPYYTEQTYHLGMMSPEPFLGWLYTGNYTTEEYDAYIGIINEQMEELNRVAGYSDRKPYEIPEYWNSEFMLSGMYAGGRNIWRITPNTFHVSKEDFLIEGTDPTFRVAGQTVTFPGGRIIEDTPITKAGSCGYWVETAKDVMPVVVNDDTRLIDIPAFGEDFESYAVDTKLTAMNTQNAGTWSVTAKGSDLVVKADGDNKVLAITGNSALKNIKMPANVTAADSYAKNQSWEVTVTIPAGMTADEAITLLNYEAELTDDEAEDDGGFKVSGGKVYYWTNNEYKELPLDVSAGGKYTFRRIVNMKDFTCDYIVLDGSGKEAASAKAAAIAAFEEKVTTVGIACDNVKGNVLLDNYNIRADGAFADFTVYEAFSGVMVDKNKAQTVSAAYRLSWMNVNAGAKTATVMAEITENGQTETKAIQEVKMGQGYDNVETGIVEIKEGQTVKLYLKTDIAGYDAPEATTPTAPTQAPTEETQVPEATQAPEATQVPTEATQAPAGTQETQAPTEAGRPVASRRPVATQNPAVTEATKETEAPEATEGTKTTQAPTEETKAPEADAPVYGSRVTKATEEAPEYEEPEYEEPEYEEPEEEEPEDEEPEEEPTEEPTEEPEEEPTEEPTEEPEEEPTEEPEEPTEAPTEPEETKGTEATNPADTDEEKGGVNVGVIIAIAVVVLAGAGAAVYFFVIKKKPAAPAAETKTEE